MKRKRGVDDAVAEVMAGSEDDEPVGGGGNVWSEASDKQPSVRDEKYLHARSFSAVTHHGKYPPSIDMSNDYTHNSSLASSQGILSHCSDGTLYKFLAVFAMLFIVIYGFGILYEAIARRREHDRCLMIGDVAEEVECGGWVVDKVENFIDDPEVGGLYLLA